MRRSMPHKASRSRRTVSAALATTVVAVGGGGIGGINGAISVIYLGADLDSTSSSQVDPSQSGVNDTLTLTSQNSQGVTGYNTTDNNSLAQPGTIGADLQSGANANLFTSRWRAVRHRRWDRGFIGAIRPWVRARVD